VVGDLRPGNGDAGGGDAADAGSGNAAAVDAAADAFRNCLRVSFIP